MAESAPKSIRLAELVHGAAWMMGLAAALGIVGMMLGKNTLGELVAGAVLVDFGATRAGVVWSASELAPGWKERARRLGKGALWGGGVVIAALIVGAIARLALGPSSKLVGLGLNPSPSFTLVLTLARAAAISVRDELLYRGIPLLAAKRGGVPDQAARVFAALAGGAAIALAAGTSPGDVMLAVASGWVFATLWHKEGGAWMAIGAHFVLALCRPRLGF